MSNLKYLELQLDSYDDTARLNALRNLQTEADAGVTQSDNVNMHCHSFFSYNPDNWSPSQIVWKASRAGLYAAALNDFDVLDGLEEFLTAGEIVGLRTAVHLETRVYLNAFSDKEITSPGEPGVTYIMGSCFPTIPEEGTGAFNGLLALREGSRDRNIALVERINPHINDVAVDYEKDVLPLTPRGNATERHIIKAYLNKSRAVFGSEDKVADYWAQVLGKSQEDVLTLLAGPAIEEALRSKLAKKGGFGYVQPSAETFPLMEDFINWVKSCKGIPMITWLDGTSDGESDPHALIECQMALGCAALNIIPDRNWNIKDEAVKAKKVANLAAMVKACDDLNLPINIGTEMNKEGLPFVDDLNGLVLSTHKASFMFGAQIMVGASILARYADKYYTACPLPLPERNALFASVGKLPPLTSTIVLKLREFGFENAFNYIIDSSKLGLWAT